MGTEDAIALPNSTLGPRTEAKQRLSSKSHQVSAKVTVPAKDEISSSDDDAHVPVTEIHLKSHEWFGDFITKHEIPVRCSILPLALLLCTCIRRVLIIKMFYGL